MTIEQILYIIAFISGYILGLNQMAWYFSKKKFIVRYDEKKKDVVIEPEEQKKGKFEFISEATQQELEEMEKPGSFQRFLKGFKKIEKEDIDDEI